MTPTMHYFLSLFFVFFVIRLPAQEYNFIHYDTRDGLASTTVYSIVKDKKGYMWFATDNGVSRFDGKKFTNFTTADGLSDNEILAVMGDSEGRLWMMPFNNSLCYYYNGRIYNKDNDSSLKKADISSNLSGIGETKNCEPYFANKEGVYIYKKNGIFKQVVNYRILAKKYNVGLTDFAIVNKNNQSIFSIYMYIGKSVFMVYYDSLVYLKDIKTDLVKNVNFVTINDSLEPVYPKNENLKYYNSVTPLNKNQICFNRSDGAWVFDLKGNLIGEPFLKNKKISHCMVDDEGNIWFSTLGEGVYRLTSVSMRTFAANDEALSIEKADDKIYAGLTDGRMEIFKDRVSKTEYLPATFPAAANSKRLYTLKSGPAGEVYMGYDSHLEKFYHDKHLISALRPIKSIDIIDKNNIVVSTKNFTFKIRSSDLKIIDTIWRERGTKVLYDNGKYYIGTLTGLVIIDSVKNITHTSGSIPLLSTRIVDMCKDAAGGIWIATNDKGIVHYQQGQVKEAINTSNGLSTNSVKSLFLKNKYLWAGTNKGINKIDTDTKKVIAKYSIADGLASDIINALYIDDNLVWVCSPAGVTFFNEKDISDSSVCMLDLHTVKVSGKKMDSLTQINLSYKNNNILFEYAAISFKSAGEIIYKYKLAGLDKDWNETNLTTLSYPSLPSGNYSLQLYAVNKFGKQSELVTISFTIAAPFWQTFWFWLIIGLAALWLIYYFITRRYRQLQKRTKEKNDLTKRIADLEQASLMAQMNPHFIFNCLNSIQHFILKNDIEKTNRYITSFGSLIRQTLDNASKTNICIADETKYLASYLELEKMRFPESFNYTMHTEPGIHADYTFIPSMILQPFVENALRHGIRHRQEGVGIITVHISKNGNGVLFSIEDNGIGRTAAAKYKSEQHIEYQSKGITLATTRLELLCASDKEKITTAVIDLKNSNGDATGTKVEIQFPDSIIEKLN